MTMEERIRTLKQKHQALDAAIEEESRRPHPDDMEITTFKKQKLRIKDELAVLTRQ